MTHYKREKDYSLGKMSLWRRVPEVWWETGKKESVKALECSVKKLSFARLTG